MYDFIRTACAVPEVSVGDTSFNTEKIIQKLYELKEKKTDIAVFPELCITGCSCQDLFFQNCLLNGVSASLKRLCKESEDLDFVFAVGAPLKINNKLFNCAVIVYCGKIKGIIPKTFIPNHDENYEKRWFACALEAETDSIMLSDIIPDCDNDYTIDFGNNIIFSYKSSVTFAAEIGGDLCSPVPQSTLLALNGAEIIINPSASNEIAARREFRKESIKLQSAKALCTYVCANAGKSESTQDLIYSGHSIISENGTVLAENKKTIDGDYILIADTDTERIKADRLKNKTFSECASLYSFDKLKTVKIGNDASVYGNGDFYSVKKSPFVPECEQERKKRAFDIFSMQVAALKKRIETTNAKAVLGISGGLDSTLALLVTAQAIKELGKASSDIIAVTMPCFGTTNRTYTNALKLMELLCVNSFEINIKEACTLHCRDIGHDINKLNVTFENVQARERTQILMDLASVHGGFVVGTGDLSELALGWCTYNADHMSMYGVNADVPKTLIKHIIDAVAETELFKHCGKILKDITETPISPELLPPDENGNIAQETESLVGPYILNDFFLFYTLRYGFSPEKIFFLAEKAFKNEFDRGTILKWLKTFYRRFFTQQFKRSCIPDGVKVGSVGLSPRGDWRMPTDASARLWLNEAEKITL